MNELDPTRKEHPEVLEALAPKHVASAGLPMGAHGVAPLATAAPGAAPQPRLLDRVREAIRTRHYSRRTEKVYVAWIKRYIFFHAKHHPADMGTAEITQFLSSLATRGRVSASTQNQAFCALLFLYREVLGRELAGLDDVVRAKRPVRLMLILSREEVAAILRGLDGPTALMGALMYGAGLRPLECASLRIKDLEFTRGEITVRNGKGQKDRVTLLPGKLAEPLRAHLERVTKPSSPRAAAAWSCPTRTRAYPMLETRQ